MGEAERIWQLEEEGAGLRGENEALRHLVAELTRRVEELEREVRRQAARRFGVRSGPCGQR